MLVDKATTTMKYYSLWFSSQRWLYTLPGNFCGLTFKMHSKKIREIALIYLYPEEKSTSMSGVIWIQVI